MVRAVHRKDFYQIARFLNTGSDQRYPVDKYMSDFAYWWDENPSFKPGDTYGWIIEDKEKKEYVKGFLGNIPCDYDIGGETITTCNPSTWYVDPDYRQEALFLAMAFNEQQDKILVNSTPSPYTEQIFLRLKYKDCAQKHKAYLKIASARIIQYLLKKKNFPSWLANVFSQAVFFTVKCMDRFFYGNSQLQIQQVVNIDRYKNSSEKPYVKHLDWILKDDTKRAYSVRKPGHSKEIGYVITQFINNQMNGLKYIQILDYSENFTLKTIHQILGQLKNEYALSVDFFLISNVIGHKPFDNMFMDVSRWLRPICLVRGDIDLDFRQVTSILGEKGFILWK